MVLSAKDVLRITGAQNVKSTVTTLPIRIRNGANLVWRSDASVQAVMATLRLALLLCAAPIVTVRILSVIVVANLGSVQ